MVAKLFEFNFDKLNWRGSLIITVGLIVSLIVLDALGLSKYWSSFAFGILFVGISDLSSRGASKSTRMRRIAIMTLAGTLLTGIGTVLGVNWALAAVGTFVVVLLVGGSEAWGKPAAYAAYLVLIWYFVSLGFHGGLTQALLEALAWLLGGALYVLLALVLFRRQSSSSQAEQESAPVQESGSVLGTYFAFFRFSSPLFHFDLLKALAAAIAVAIGLGFNLPYAYWIPLFTHIVMQPGVQDSFYLLVLRLLATIVGAVLASVLLGTIHNNNVILEVIAVICVFIGVAVHNVNLLTYLFFSTLSILLLDSLSAPGTLTDVRARVLNVLIGSLIAVAFALLYQAIEKMWPSSVATG